MSEEKKITSVEKLQEFKELRAEELSRYGEELVSFLKERNIDLTATITASDKGNEVTIHIIDTLK